MPTAKSLKRRLPPAKKHKAKLVIAKLDRLSRNLAFIATLMESGVEFRGCGLPEANKLTVHILAAMAEHEREQISKRTRDALDGRQKAGKAPRQSRHSRGCKTRQGRL